MTDMERKEWINRIESALKEFGGEGGGIMDKLKGIGSKLLGEGKEIPGDIEEKAHTALKYLKDPGSSDSQIENALAPIKELMAHFKK